MFDKRMKGKRLTDALPRSINCVCRIENYSHYYFFGELELYFAITSSFNEPQRKHVKFFVESRCKEWSVEDYWRTQYVEWSSK